MSPGSPALLYLLYSRCIPRGHLGPRGSGYLSVACHMWGKGFGRDKGNREKFICQMELLCGHFSLKGAEKSPGLGTPSLPRHLVSCHHRRGDPGQQCPPSKAGFCLEMPPGAGLASL